MHGIGITVLPFLKGGVGPPVFPLHLWQVLLALLLVCAALVAIAALLLAAQVRRIAGSSHHSDQRSIVTEQASDHLLTAEVTTIARR